MADNSKLMRATPEWMRENYNRFNQELFDGELGECHFEVFTTGRGSQGRTLGRFKLRNPNLYVTRYDGSMYVDSYNGRKYINKDNFVNLCAPCIMMNGHYSGTEEALQGTLVHEMCHYYDYMDGSCPKQAHGPRFRQIASVVSSRSNGMFTIQRLASAEEMRNYELDQEMKEKKEKRIVNKKARTLAIIVYKVDGNVELTMVANNNERILEEIYNYYTKRGVGKANEIITSSDPELIEELYNKGYRKLMRTWRYWNIGDKPWLGDIKKYNYNTILHTNNVQENKNMEMKIEENIKKNVSKIVESVVNEYVDSIGNDDIRIGDIDLELHSPLEGLD